VFCSPRCSTRFRDLRRYHANVERDRERSRRYYAEHGEEVLARARARLLAERPDLRDRRCSECGSELTGRQRVVCSPQCREVRFKRLHPESYARREAAKVKRRRERRAAAKARA
jgi:YHS domain-containing protein